MSDLYPFLSNATLIWKPSFANDMPAICAKAAKTQITGNNCCLLQSGYCAQSAELQSDLKGLAERSRGCPEIVASLDLGSIRVFSRCSCQGLGGYFLFQLTRPIRWTVLIATLTVILGDVEVRVAVYSIDRE